MVTSAPTRGRPRAFDRDAALDHAVRLFWRKGYEATSVRDLGDEIGIGQPSLYNAFGGKRALFGEAVRVYDQRYGGLIEVALADEPTAARAIRRILAEAPARYTQDGLPRGCLVAGGDAGADDADVHDLLAQVRAEKARELTTKINADRRSGELPADTDAEALAGYVMTVLNGLAQRARDGATRQELEKIAAIAVTVVPGSAG